MLAARRSSDHRHARFTARWPRRRRRARARRALRPASGPFELVLLGVGRMASVEDLERAKARALDTRASSPPTCTQASAPRDLWPSGSGAGLAHPHAGLDRGRPAAVLTAVWRTERPGTWITRIFDGNFRRAVRARPVGSARGGPQRYCAARTITVFRSHFVPLFTRSPRAKSACEE